MYNFHNLCDFEFESLCKDIMERKLQAKLRIFGKGKDDGIDIVDDIIDKNIVIQVKHYINSSQSDLKRSLRREVEKVKKLNPKQYYICCSKDLTNKTVEQIYEMFSDYMTSTKNIIMLNEINEILNENKDIVDKHYKLWLESTDVLSKINNRHIFIDCESLLYGIEDEAKLFVETEAFKKCKQILNDNRLLLILGSPGVGKTMTTKMLALYYANEGYSIRYTTNGDIKDLKNSSLNNDQKEVFILDDCLGQHYFNMKLRQEEELLSLIGYVSRHKNKMIILNSRVTIYNEAKDRSDTFTRRIQDEEIKLHILDMNNISQKDKGLIFYNHLFHKEVPPEYYNNIKKDKMYVKIVNHKNYTPRIVEFITRKYNYKQIKSNEYVKYIMSTLEYPDKIWNDEFTRKLKKEDRIFMTTLYSLTDVTVKSDILKRIFNERIKKENDIDITKDIFKEVLGRLNNSFITLYDNNGIKEIGVLNPSVNDYLRGYLKSNDPERQDIIENITESIQLKRMLDNKDEKLNDMLNNGYVLRLNYNDSTSKIYTILSYICEKDITSHYYVEIIESFMNDLSYREIEDCLTTSQIIIKLFQEPLFSYYNIDTYFEENNIRKFFDSMDLNNINEFFIEIGENCLECNFISEYSEIIEESIIKSIDDYIKYIQVDIYCQNYNIKKVIKDCSYQGELDYYKAISMIKEWIKEDVYNEINRKIDSIPLDIKSNLDIRQEIIYVNEHSLENFISSYLKISKYNHIETIKIEEIEEIEEMEILDLIFK